MNDVSPAGRGSSRRPGGMHFNGNTPDGLQALAARVELRDRAV